MRIGDTCVDYQALHHIVVPPALQLGLEGQRYALVIELRHPTWNSPPWRLGRSRSKRVKLVGSTPWPQAISPRFVHPLRQTRESHTSCSWLHPISGVSSPKTRTISSRGGKGFHMWKNVSALPVPVPVPTTMHEYPPYTYCWRRGLLVNLPAAFIHAYIHACIHAYTHAYRLLSEYSWSPMRAYSIG